MPSQRRNHVDLTLSTSQIRSSMRGLTWKAYQEGMGAPCGLITQGRYAARHDPFVYFNDVSGWDGTAYQPSPRCNEHSGRLFAARWISPTMRCRATRLSHWISITSSARLTIAQGDQSAG